MSDQPATGPLGIDRTWDTVRFQLESNLRAMAHWGLTRTELRNLDYIARDTSILLEQVLARVSAPAPEGYQYVIQQNWNGHGGTEYGWENVGYEETLAEAQENLRAYKENQRQVPARLVLECQQCHAVASKIERLQHRPTCSQP